jgi:hypothetical protein
MSPAAGKTNNPKRRRQLAALSLAVAFVTPLGAGRMANVYAQVDEPADTTQQAAAADDTAATTTTNTVAADEAGVAAADDTAAAIDQALPAAKSNDALLRQGLDELKAEKYEEAEETLKQVKTAGLSEDQRRRVTLAQGQAGTAAAARRSAREQFRTRRAGTARRPDGRGDRSLPVGGEQPFGRPRRQAQVAGAVGPRPRDARAEGPADPPRGPQPSPPRSGCGSYARGCAGSRCDRERPARRAGT